MQRIDESEIKKIMADAEIQTASIGFGSIHDKNEIPPVKFGDQNIFGAASLSKLVFTYLVLKLIANGVLEKDTKLDEATQYDADTKQDKKILSFAEFCAKNKINLVDSDENKERAKLFTPDLLLSHQTGLPIGYNTEKYLPLNFDFEPGNGYAYSGYNMMYLQQWIENKTGRKLQELAKEFVFDKAIMPNSTFDTPNNINAANSLHTTAEEYVRFCLHWMKDKDPLAQEAFTSKVSLTNDPWAIRALIPSNTLEHLAWGYGWGLEKNDSGEVVSAFHTGDMGKWRAGVKLDLVAKTVTVFFSESSFENGHLLQEPIFGKSYALDYFFDKYKFARDIEELKSDWKENRSFGTRKEPAQASLAKEGPENAAQTSCSTKDILARVCESSPKLVPPKPSVASNVDSPIDASQIRTVAMESKKADSPTTANKEESHIKPKLPGYSTKLKRE